MVLFGLIDFIDFLFSVRLMVVGLIDSWRFLNIVFDEDFCFEMFFMMYFLKLEVYLIGFFLSFVVCEEMVLRRGDKCW